MHAGGRDDIEEEGSAFNIERALSAIRRRLHIVALVAGVATGISIAVALILPNRYEASAIVQIDPRKKSISNLDGVLSELRADAATVESEVEVIRSRAITLRVIDTLGLRMDPELTGPAFLHRLTGMFMQSDEEDRGGRAREPDGGLLGASSPGAGVPERDEIAAGFADRLKVARVRNTLLIDIRYSSADPVKAARIANAVAEFYLKDQLESKQEAAGLATGMLERKLDEMRVKVADDERQVERFKVELGIFDSEGQVLSERQLARHMEQTVIAGNTTAEARAKYEQVNRLIATGKGSDTIADVLASHTVRLMKEQVAAATRRQAELSTKYGPKHPEMLKVRAEAADAQSQVDAEIARLVANLKNEYEVAQARERQLVTEMESLQAQQSVSKEASIRLKEYERQAATSRELYQALLSRYKQTSETQGLQLPDARIVEQADVPLQVAGPKRKRLVVLGLIAGLLAGLALALAMEFATPGVSRPEDVERTLDVAHLASVPIVEGPAGAGLDPTRAARLILAEPLGAFAESIRGIRRALDVERPHSGPRIVLVSSALPGEGAEMIASNVAHHYALTGDRILLIDADLRRAPLTRRLAPQRTCGLLDILSQGLAADRAILRDQSTGLHFLPAAGPIPLQPASPELLASNRMAAAVGALKRHFDTIVIDAPPLLPVIDGRILADFADQIVFVMSWRRTPKPLARRALRLLGANESKIVGVVVNQVDPRSLEDAQGFAMAPTAPFRPPSRWAA